ncbi:hypothetical protein Ddye_005238 [Dipteronia dyeriana]|uniref:BED-type domain-containing protein n=1 Tax=Dipteronia dyeriana TaxID=168575 RepID=A0AAE0CPF5_9ROSI|nr:hypothetical protein Ddye_005238 [Dipteronia dyeriana]
MKRCRFMKAKKIKPKFVDQIGFPNLNCISIFNLLHHRRRRHLLIVDDSSTAVTPLRRRRRLLSFDSSRQSSLFTSCILVLKMSNRKDPAWKYGVEVEMDGQKGYKYLQCKFCDKILKGGVYRMKEHLAGIHGNAAPCAKALQR